MGFATIVSGGTAGRYSIAIDYGSATQTAVLAALSLKLAQLDVRLATAQAAVTTADEREAVQIARYHAAIDSFIDAHGAGYAPGSPRPDDSAIIFELKALRTMQVAHLPSRITLDAVKFERADTLRTIAKWNAFVPTESRDVWCTDYTEDAAPGSVVATMDIPGESTLMVLAPGCRAWGASDGALIATDVMSPAQAYFNAAIFPGWQIDLPTYRWGTVTAIDYEGATLDVTLAVAVSSAQSLDVNDETSLAAVPVDYMGTGSVVFEPDDRVVVKFLGQSWASPRVEGFLDNPRPPGDWEALWSVSQPVTTPSVGYDEAVGFALRSGSTLTSSDVLTPALSGALQVQMRVDGGSWSSLTWSQPNASTGAYDFGGVFVLLFSSAFIYGQIATFTLPQPIGVSLGATVEVRAYIGSDLILNAAMVREPTAGTHRVAVVGRLIPVAESPDPGYKRPMTRLTYSLAGPP